jgi:Uncharacterized protein conserved in bacteria (DUF2252)
MRKMPIDVNNKMMTKILEGYLKSRKEENFLKDYDVEEAGRGKGTFGNKRFLIVLNPKQKNTQKDKLLLELKTVYQDADTKYYFNPYKHHGLRMIKASELYAPELEQRLGFTTFKNIEYWGRQIPPKSAKIKDKLNEFEQVDIAYSVATQLGKAHRKSIQKEVRPNQLIKHFDEHYNEFIGIAVQMNDELIQGHQKYVEFFKNQASKIIKPTILNNSVLETSFELQPEIQLETN